MKRLFLLVGLFIASVAHGDIHSLFVKGNEAYYNEDWDEAISFYEQSLHYGESDEQHFNLANAFVQKERYGRAILHYMKAEALNPTNQGIQANLQLVRKTLDLEQPETSILRGMAYLLSPNAWTFSLCIAFWIAFATFFLRRVYRNIPEIVARFLVSFAILIMIVSIISLSYFHAQKDLGVVLEKDTALHVAPTDSSPSNSSLGEGDVAKLIKEYEGFYFLEGPDNEQGWIRKDHFDLIWQPKA